MQKSMVMDKLIEKLSARFPDLTEEDILLSVETIINAMSAQLISGGRIELRRFGTFSLNAQVIDACRNTVLDTDTYVTESPMVIFKPGQVIRESVNNLD